MMNYHKAIPLLVLLSCFYSLRAQDGKPAKMSYDSVLHVDTLAFNKEAPFTKQWDYPWWVTRHDDGSFQSALSDSITAEDTLHIYRTAYVVTTHQGTHVIKHCKASLKNDTLSLVFFPYEGAAYSGCLVVDIVKDRVSSRWECKYPNSRIKDEVNTFTILSQKLTVNTSDVKPGTVIKGSVSVSFREDFSAPGHEPESYNYKVSGIFQTLIQAE